MLFHLIVWGEQVKELNFLGHSRPVAGRVRTPPHRELGAFTEMTWQRPGEAGRSLVTPPPLSGGRATLKTENRKQLYCMSLKAIVTGLLNFLDSKN